MDAGKGNRGGSMNWAGVTRHFDSRGGRDQEGEVSLGGTAKFLFSPAVPLKLGPPLTFRSCRFSSSPLAPIPLFVCFCSSYLRCFAFGWSQRRTGAPSFRPRSGHPFSRC